MIDSFYAGFAPRDTIASDDARIHEDVILLCLVKLCRHANCMVDKRRILNPEVVARAPAYTDYRYQGMRHCWSFRCDDVRYGQWAWREIRHVRTCMFMHGIHNEARASLSWWMRNFALTLLQSKSRVTKGHYTNPGSCKLILPATSEF